MRKHYRFPPLTVCRCGCPRSLWVEERGSCHSLWLVHVWFLIAVWLSLSLFLVSCHWEWRGWRGDVGFGWLFPEHPSSMLLAPTAVWLPPFAVEVSTRTRARTPHARAHRLIGVLERMPRTTPPSHSHRESGCSFSTYNPVRPPCKSARMQSRAPPPVARRGTPSRVGGLLTPPGHGEGCHREAAQTNRPLRYGQATASAVAGLPPLPPPTTANPFRGNHCGVRRSQPSRCRHSISYDGGHPSRC